MEKYKKILVDKGIKPTFQRMKVLEYLDRSKTHSTVDMIYTALCDTVPTLSKTTVYNTLDVLRKSDLVSVLSITESELRYECSTESHHHFLCKTCGRIIDIEIKCPFLEQMKVCEHKLEEVQGYFKGICEDCLRDKQ